MAVLTKLLYEYSLSLEVVEPLVHEVVGAGSQVEGGMVGHCQSQGELVAAGVGYRHLEAGVELEHSLRGLEGREREGGEREGGEREGEEGEGGQRGREGGREREGGERGRERGREETSPGYSLSKTDTFS